MEDNKIKNESEPQVIADALARRVVSILVEKKAHNVCAFHVGEDNPVTDYYINATGRSANAVASLADIVVDKLAEEGISAHRVEGKRGDGWILVDYGNVIVNVFDEESRKFYNLDRLMPELSIRDISDIIKEVDEKLGLQETNI